MHSAVNIYQVGISSLRQHVTWRILHPCVDLLSGAPSTWACNSFLATSRTSSSLYPITQILSILLIHLVQQVLPFLRDRHPLILIALAYAWFAGELAGVFAVPPGIALTVKIAESTNCVHG